MLHVYEIEPWIAYPSHCEIEFFFMIEETIETGENIIYEDYILQDWRTGAIEIQADDLELLVNPGNAEKNYTITI